MNEKTQYTQRMILFIELLAKVKCVKVYEILNETKKMRKF